MKRSRRILAIGLFVFLAALLAALPVLAAPATGVVRTTVPFSYDVETIEGFNVRREAGSGYMTIISTPGQSDIIMGASTSTVTISTLDGQVLFTSTSQGRAFNLYFGAMLSHSHNTNDSVTTHDAGGVTSTVHSTYVISNGTFKIQQIWVDGVKIYQS